MTISFLVTGFVLAMAMTEVKPTLISTPAPATSELNAADSAEFERVVKLIDEWDSRASSYRPIKAALDLLLASHPDSVPIKVEASRLEWIRISDGLGLFDGSRSALPWFLEYQKLAPSYAKSYTLAARAYVFIGDFGGALPSLRKATELAPDEPWVDLTWSLFHSRQLDRPNAVKFAKAAIPKAGNDAPVVAHAISLITRNNGVMDSGAVDQLVESIGNTQSDPAFLTSVVAETLTYGYQPGLWEIAAGLARLAAQRAGPTPPVLLQWASIAMEGGGAYLDPDGLDPAFAKHTSEILTDLRNVPEVERKVWGLLIDLAMYNRNFDYADSLIAVGHAKGYDPIDVSLKRASLLTAQDKPREVAQLYLKENLPADDRLMAAKSRIGAAEEARRYYLSRIKDDPTSAYRLGNFADFMLFYFNDAGSAIDFAERAIKVMPYPLVKRTLASAYLTQSGQLLSEGSLDAALDSFERAQDSGFDEQDILAACYGNCREIRAALAAFR